MSLESVATSLQLAKGVFRTAIRGDIEIFKRICGKSI